MLSQVIQFLSSTPDWSTSKSKRVAFQAAQASAPDAILPANPRFPTQSSGPLLLRLSGLVLLRP
jgi:hypothetical protein